MLQPRWCALLTVISLAIPALAIAQAPIKLTLESGADLGPGKIAVAKGTASSKQVRFSLDGVDVAQPITVVVSSADPAKKVDVIVAKDNYDDPQDRATTGADGTATLQLRTQGDFGVAVTAASPVNFMLAVWVGDAVPPETKSFLAPVKDYSAATLAQLPGNAGAVTPAAAAVPAQGTSLFSWIALAIGGVLAIGVVLIGVAMMRRKPQGGQ